MNQIIPHYDYCNVASEQGANGILWTLFEAIPFASRRVASFATEADARYFIELCRETRASKSSKPTEQRGMKTAEEWYKIYTDNITMREVLMDYDGVEKDIKHNFESLVTAIQQNAIASRDNEVWKCCEELANALVDVQRHFKDYNAQKLTWHKDPQVMIEDLNKAQSALATFTALKLKMEGK
jgi:hypothetical protein